MKRSLITTALLMITALSLMTALFLGRETSGRCAFDGSRIERVYEVTACYENGSPINFACVLNARMWLERHPENAPLIWVTDEETGRRIAADRAFYVLSAVITTPHTRNRIHVFGKRSAAEMHALLFAGRMVKNPFSFKKKQILQAKIRCPKTDRSPVAPSGCSVQKCLGPRPCAGFPADENWTRVSFEASGRLAAGFSRVPEKPPRLNATCLVLV